MLRWFLAFIILLFIFQNIFSEGANEELFYNKLQIKLEKGISNQHVAVDILEEECFSGKAVIADQKGWYK